MLLPKPSINHRRTDAQEVPIDKNINATTVGIEKNTKLLEIFYRNFYSKIFSSSSASEYGTVPGA